MKTRTSYVHSRVELVQLRVKPVKRNRFAPLTLTLTSLLKNGSGRCVLVLGVWAILGFLTGCSAQSAASASPRGAGNAGVELTGIIDAVGEVSGIDAVETIPEIDSGPEVDADVDAHGTDPELDATSDANDAASDESHVDAVAGEVFTCGIDAAVMPPDIQTVKIPTSEFWIGCPPVLAHSSKDASLMYASGCSSCYSSVFLKKDCKANEYAYANPACLANSLACTQERLALRVIVSAYIIDREEATVHAYKACIAAGVCAPPMTYSSNNLCTFGSPAPDSLPVNCVSWAQARTFCSWRKMRLPTEAEWELAAKGSCAATKCQPCHVGARTYPWSHGCTGALLSCKTAVHTSAAQGASCKPSGPSTVGTLPAGASIFGLLDMAGNVAEWVDDVYVDGHKAELKAGVVQTAIDPNWFAFAPNGAVGPDYPRTFRGGSWADGPADLTTTARGGHDKPSSVFSHKIGFRCANGLKGP